MGYTTKSPKGEISIDNHRGKIRLRWRVNGERFELGLPYPYLSENMHHATVKSAEIKLDIMKGSFDASLVKYKPVKAGKLISPDQLQDKDFKRVNELIDAFNQWVITIKSVDVENAYYYLYARKLLEKWGTLPLENVPTRLSNEVFSPTTYNDRLTCLCNFFTWLLKKRKISSNPLEEVSRRKKRKKINDKRRPLSEAEILTFLDAIKRDLYCPKSSAHKHSYYYPFFKFIFLTGVRNAEAIGLRVKHVNTTLQNIEISETLARTRRGSHHAARVRKGTKTENVRYLPLTEELELLLLPQIEGKQPDDFVFPSPKGLSINDKTLQDRIFKPVMIALGFGKKDLYVARHSYGTRSIEQGISATSTAYAMGHATVETAIRNYVNVVKPSTTLATIK